MVKKFRHLIVPDHWEHYWTKYPEGYTILEALLNWVGQVDNMIDNVNEWNEYLDDFVATFDKNLQGQVVSTLSEWQDSGFLDVVIDEALQTQMDVLEQETQEKLNQFSADLADIVVNIKSFGAQGGGVIDDTVAIQNAMNYVSEVGGGVVLIPEGTYLSSRLYIPSKVHLKGTHRDVSILKVAELSTYTPFIVNKLSGTESYDEDIIISDLTIDGNRTIQDQASEYNHGIAFRGVKNSSIERCRIINCQGDAISIAANSTTRHMKCENIVIRNCITDNIYRNNMAILNVLNAIIEENQFYGSPYVASINLETHNVEDVIQDVTIRDNVFKTSVRGVIILDTFSATIRGINILDNEFETKGISSTNARGLTVKGNTFRNIDGNCIVSNTSKSSLELDFHIFDDNDFYNVDGIVLYLYGRYEHLSVARNSIKTSGNAGIWVTGASSGVIEENVVLDATGAGIRIQDENSNLIIKGNICRNTTMGENRTQTYGIYIPNSQAIDCVISDNICTNHIIKNIEIIPTSNHFVKTLDRSAGTSDESIYHLMKFISGRIQLGSYSLWADASGKLRIKKGIPTSDTDGTVVGTQT